MSGGHKAKQPQTPVQKAPPPAQKTPSPDQKTSTRSAKASNGYKKNLFLLAVIKNEQRARTCPAEKDSSFELVHIEIMQNELIKVAGSEYFHGALISSREGHGDPVSRNASWDRGERPGLVVLWFCWDGGRLVAARVKSQSKFFHTYTCALPRGWKKAKALSKDEQLRHFVDTHQLAEDEIPLNFSIEARRALRDHANFWNVYSDGKTDIDPQRAAVDVDIRPCSKEGPLQIRAGQGKFYDLTPLADGVNPLVLVFEVVFTTIYDRNKNKTALGAIDSVRRLFSNSRITSAPKESNRHVRWVACYNFSKEEYIQHCQNSNVRRAIKYEECYSSDAEDEPASVKTQAGQQAITSKNNCPVVQAATATELGLQKQPDAMDVQEDPSDQDIAGNASIDGEPAQVVQRSPRPDADEPTMSTPSPKRPGAVPNNQNKRAKRESELEARMRRKQAYRETLEKDEAKQFREAEETVSKVKTEDMRRLAEAIQNNVDTLKEGMPKPHDLACPPPIHINFAWESINDGFLAELAVAMLLVHTFKNNSFWWTSRHAVLLRDRMVNETLADTDADRLIAAVLERCKDCDGRFPEAGTDLMVQGSTSSDLHTLFKSCKAVDEDTADQVNTSAQATRLLVECKSTTKSRMPGFGLTNSEYNITNYFTCPGQTVDHLLTNDYLARNCGLTQGTLGNPIWNELRAQPKQEVRCMQVRVTKPDDSSIRIQFVPPGCLVDDE